MFKHYRDNLKYFITGLAMFLVGALAAALFIYLEERTVGHSRGLGGHVFTLLFAGTAGLIFGRLLKNIKERKIESKRKEEWQRLTGIVEVTSDMVGTSTPEGQLTYLNKAGYEMLGWDPEKGLGGKYIPNAHPTWAYEKIGGEAIPYALEHGIWHGETALLNGEGKEFPVSQVIMAHKSQSGELEYLSTVVRDLSAIKEAKRAAWEGELRFRNIVESSPMGMHMYELQEGDRLVFVGANPAADRLLNVKNSQFIGKTLEEAFPPLAETEIPHRYRAAAKDGVPWYTEQVIYEDDQIKGAFEVHAFQTAANQMVAVFLEITERKIAEEKIKKLNQELEKRVKERTQQLETANRGLESFNYSVSHDLRAPLRAIDGFARALLEDYEEKLDDQGKDYLSRVCNGAVKMGTLIDDMLKLSRVTTYEMEIDPIDMSALVEEVVRDLKIANPERELEFIVAPGQRTKGDRHLIKIALQNLLGNAVKYTAKQERAVIEFGCKKLEGGDVFFISDNGAGFNQKYKEKLFVPFQRLHRAENFPGSGIGLSIVERIVHKHRGRIWAEGEEGKGATFYFTF